MERPKGYSARINQTGYTDGNGWPYGTKKFAVTIVGKRGTLSFQYHTGPAITEAPTLRDVVQAAISDGSFYEMNPTLTEFGLESGYDDSQHAERLEAFKACRRMSEGTRRVFGDDYDAMAEWSADN